MQSTRSRQARPVGAARKAGVAAHAETGIAGVIAGLQRSAGNRAVSALIARDEDKKQAPGTTEKTVVMPDPIGTLELVSFNPGGGKDVDVLVRSSAADPVLMKAAQNGDFFDQVTITYDELTVTLTKVVIAHAAQSSDSAISVRFNASGVDQKYKRDDPDGEVGVAPGWNRKPPRG